MVDGWWQLSNVFKPPSHPKQTLSHNLLLMPSAERPSLSNRIALPALTVHCSFIGATILIQVWNAKCQQALFWVQQSECIKEVLYATLRYATASTKCTQRNVTLRTSTSASTCTRMSRVPGLAWKWMLQVSKTLFAVLSFVKLDCIALHWSAIEWPLPRLLLLLILLVKDLVPCVHQLTTQTCLNISLSNILAELDIICIYLSPIVSAIAPFLPIKALWSASSSRLPLPCHFVHFNCHW